MQQMSHITGIEKNLMSWLSVTVELFMYQGFSSLSKLQASIQYLENPESFSVPQNVAGSNMVY